MTPAELTAVAGTLPVSLAKLAERWATLWAEWDGIVLEATDEEGDYYEQEEEWEPPYFDAYAFMEDLEKVAVKLRPLVRTAFENSFLPNHGFAEALQAAAAANIAIMHTGSLRSKKWLQRTTSPSWQAGALTITAAVICGRHLPQSAWIDSLLWVVCS